MPLQPSLEGSRVQVPQASPLGLSRLTGGWWSGSAQRWTRSPLQNLLRTTSLDPEHRCRTPARLDGDSIPLGDLKE